MRMKWIFAPAIALVAPLKNNIRVPLGGALFAVPLAISLWSPPASWQSGSAIAIGLTFLLAWYYLIAVYFSATESWGAVNRLAQRLNEHDLRRLEGLEGRTQQNAGQFGFMINTLSEAQSKLRELVREARHSADAAKTAADEMATGNVNLSQRTEQQASTLEETASGMEELAATVKQNADNCKLASELASNASGVASKGAEMVHRIVINMEQIDKSSKKIVDIIGVIESIAFQTNILALNAAVEAARAGEQGRGFAVVAGEVRNLAQRSAAAAKEIKTLIGESVSNVDQGAKLVRDSGHVINDVVVSVQQVSELISEIAVASREQNSGVQEMNKALIQLESVTQQNAALVEEAAASAMTFQDEARRLFELVGQFKLDDEDDEDYEYDYPLPAQEPAARPAAVPELARPAARQDKPGGSRPAVKADPDDEWQEF
jgi:methyl-accepting chemotaxis protein